MTPAQLAVERDALLVGGRTLETVGTMQSAAAGELQMRVAVMVREALVRRLDVARVEARGWVGVPVSLDAVMVMATDIIGRVDLTPIIESVSPPNGTSGETP